MSRELPITQTKLVQLSPAYKVNRHVKKWVAATMKVTFLVRTEACESRKNGFGNENASQEEAREVTFEFIRM